MIANRLSRSRTSSNIEPQADGRDGAKAALSYQTKIVMKGVRVGWNHELLASLIWLGNAFVISLIGLTITVAALSRYTGWGRQIRRITWAYFNPFRSKLPLAWLALI